MESLEKKTYLLPIRYYQRKNRIYAAFDLSVIPQDMEISTMYLHLPLSPGIDRITVSAILVPRGMTKVDFKRGILPPQAKLYLKTAFKNQPEVSIDLTKITPVWRQQELPGIYLRLSKALSKKEPPFLVLEVL